MLANATVLLLESKTLPHIIAFPVDMRIGIRIKDSEIRRIIVKYVSLILVMKSFDFIKKEKVIIPDRMRAIPVRFDRKASDSISLGSE
jgi:hypothetical protein